MVWYIDSIDVLAGMAFASERAPDLLSKSGETFEPAGQAFIAPPDFAPEIGVSRATAFAAARGSFQLGLFIDEEEVPFPSLESLAEFVRRAYLRGGGGDDPRGVVPPVPEGGPDLSGAVGIEREDREFYSDPSDPSDPIVRLVARVGDFRAESVKIDRAAGADQFAWLVGTASPGSDAAAGTVRLVSGGFSVLIELLRRHPGPNVGDRLPHWLEAARRLSAAFDRIGLWIPLGELIAKHSHLSSVADEIARYLDERDGLNEIRRVVDQQAVAWSDLFFLRNVLRYGTGAWRGRQGWWLSSGWDLTTDHDLFADLSHFPVPGRVKAGGARHENENLSALLMSAVAVPELGGTGDAAELLLFAAACLVSPGLVAQRTGSLLSPAGFPDRETAGRAWAAIAPVTRAALFWLTGNLPKHVFWPGLEDLIAKAVSPRLTR